MRFKSVIILMLGAILLSACSGESTEETMYEHMEESVKLESDFVAQQQPLSELEQEEQELYQQISELTIDEFDDIQALSERAIESIEERRDHIEIELESIEASKKEFDEVIPFIEELEDEALQSLATEMVNLMDERYQAFLTMHSAYQQSLDNDVELYELLMQEDLEEPEFSEQIEAVNSQYQEIIDANVAFNDATEAFNEQKRAFYEASDLNITYE